MLPLTEPGDCRPAHVNDYTRLAEAIEYEFNSQEIYNFFFRDRFVLLNKVPFIDLMYEVVSSGNVWGQIYYDILVKKWRFRLTAYGAQVAYNNNLVDYVKINGKILKGSLITKSTSSNQVIVVDDKGFVRGLAEKINDKLVVTKVFRRVKPPVETSWRRSDLGTVLKMNENALYSFEEKSMKFLEKIGSRYPYQPVVSYSGGKDSLVALDLAVKTYGSVKMLFNDTGLELPETYRNVEEVSKHYSIDVIEASAGDAFWKNIDFFGPPGKDYRWCCKLAKLIPIARTCRLKLCRGAINIVGQRAFESIDRAKSPVLWRNRWIPYLTTTTPIQDWGQIVVWLYIFRYKLPFNKLYEEGFERLGCYLCPSSYLAEYSEISRKYPELWMKWIGMLEEWRLKLNQPREYVDYGLWRWVTPAIAKNRVMKKIRFTPNDWRIEYVSRLAKCKFELTPLRVEKKSSGLEIEFSNNCLRNNEEIEVFVSNVKNMYNWRTSFSNENIVVETGKVEIHINRNRIFVEPCINSDEYEDLFDTIKVIYRVRGCTLCGSCSNWCPLQVIVLTKHGPKVCSKCVNCRICLEACPVAENIVEKLVLPLLTGDPRVWKRRSRRRIDENYFTLIQLNVMRNCK
ncbi:MAG: phosphoadenosine phosphosulfate reductase family protein [Desulfurococcaceae archaeon]